MSTNSSYTRAGSIGFAEAGRRLRASRQRLLESAELSDSVRAWKIWAACAELTASWSKGSDRVHVATIANLAGLRADKVSPILRAFHEQGIFGWVKSTVPKERRSPGILSLPSLGIKETKQTPEAKGCPSCGVTDPSFWDAAEGTCAICD